MRCMYAALVSPPSFGDMLINDGKGPAHIEGSMLVSFYKLVALSGVLCAGLMTASVRTWAWARA